MTSISKLGSVGDAPSHHSGAQGRRDFAGRERSGGSGAIAAAGGAQDCRGLVLFFK